MQEPGKNIVQTTNSHSAQIPSSAGEMREKKLLEEQRIEKEKERRGEERRGKKRINDYVIDVSVFRCLLLSQISISRTARSTQYSQVAI